ncbi:PTS glucose transporter subunit IIA [Streptosporangium sp. KLBMP 9127]|nr:PTS glucose transporter subunit IIA [Streptosporangium sp. KLBMP 9127]
MTTVLAPMGGTAVRLAEVPDPVFSAGMVGPGLAIDPVREPVVAVAPIDGIIMKLHPHAFVIVGDDGRGVLVHLGIDTVQLRGAGFELLTTEGARIRAGQPVVSWNPVSIEASGRSPVCPVVALDGDADYVTGLAHGRIDAGDDLFEWA